MSTHAIPPADEAELIAADPTDAADGQQQPAQQPDAPAQRPWAEITDGRVTHLDIEGARFASKNSPDPNNRAIALLVLRAYRMGFLMGVESGL